MVEAILKILLITLSLFTFVSCKELKPQKKQVTPNPDRKPIMEVYKAEKDKLSNEGHIVNP